MIDRIEMNGYWYQYEHRVAKDRIDFCLATKDPKEYCNGIFMYSMKDPGSGVEFVVTDTNEPVLKAKLLLKQAQVCSYCGGSGYDPYPNHDTTMRPCTKCSGV